MSDVQPRMPAEFEAHERTWMAFPPSVYGGASPALAQAAWADVARTVARFEPVTLVVTPEDHRAATALLGTAVEYLECPLDDAWMRDMGPTFVRLGEEVTAVDWTFNGWGAQSWATWEHDRDVASVVASAANVRAVSSSLVNEGGGIEVNGAGLVLLTRTVQLDQGRNPTWSQRDVEEELQRQLGVDRCVWFERGLTGDYLEFGTRGHVDLLAKFVTPTTVVVHYQDNPDHPDFALSAALERTLLDVGGLDVVRLPAPLTQSVDGRVCDYSYVNCSFVNEGLVLGVYNDPRDAVAEGVLRELIGDRTIATVDARPLFALGGGVHCITQQQPRRMV